MSIRKSKIDIGLIWAKYINTWGQVGAVAGTVNLIMMLGVFYTTTLRPAVSIPLWLYATVVAVSATIGVLFVLKIGISGYYRFFSKTSELSEAHKRIQEADRKIDLIMDKLGIENNEDNNEDGVAQ